MSNTLQETQDISEIVNRGLKKRYRSEFMFRFYGVVSILFAVVFLLVFSLAASSAKVTVPLLKVS